MVRSSINYPKYLIFASRHKHYRQKAPKTVTTPHWFAVSMVWASLIFTNNAAGHKPSSIQEVKGD